MEEALLLLLLMVRRVIIIQQGISHILSVRLSIIRLLIVDYIRSQIGGISVVAVLTGP